MRKHGTTPVVFYSVPPEDVCNQLTELIHWLQANERVVCSLLSKLTVTEILQLHPVTLATVAHYNVVRVQPFSAGNGRVARLFMNLLLLRGQFSPAVIEPEERDHYLRCLEDADDGNILPFIEF